MLDFIRKTAFVFITCGAMAYSHLSLAANYNNFILNIEFTDSNGNGGSSRKSICKCDSIHLQNKSVTTNNFPIGNGLTTGNYVITNDLTGIQIAVIPAADWTYNEIKTIQICQNFSGQTLNLRINHTGPGINSGIRQDKLYLNTYQAVVNAGADTNVCQGNNVQLNGSGANSYHWSPSTGLNNPNISNPIASLLQSQSYTLTASQTFNTTLGNPSSLTCPGSDSVQVNVDSLYSCDVGRTGMTWEKNEIEPISGIVEVGCGSNSDKCNPYQGDRACTDVLPVLCYNPLGLNAPTNADVPPSWFLTPSPYHKWSGGLVATTPAISPQAENLVTIDNANAYCSATFGPGWRVAEFHDGTHWNFWAYGNTADNTRFWTNINDQKNGNCWIAPN